MASSTLITDYIGLGTHAARPATPNVPVTGSAFYFETDTDTVFVWTGSVWLALGGTMTALLDAAFGATEGEVLYRGASTWAALAPGTANQVLASGGSGAAPAWQSKKYVLGAFVPGVLTTNQLLLLHRFSKAVTIPANFGAFAGSNSEAGGTANATASTVIGVNKAPTATPNTFSAVGTITIAASSVTPTFATSGGTAISFAQGDVLSLEGPATADATFAGFYATLVGSET